MSLPARPGPRLQSAAEEAANSVSHGVGLLLAVAALPLLVQASQAGVGLHRHLAAVCVFAATMILLYLSSALFHGLPPGRGKHLFGKLDHAAIYLFIAGSYSPFAATALLDTRAWLMLGLVWLLALAGALVTLFDLVRNPLWSTAMYVALGWLVLVAALPALEQVSATGVWLLVAGGGVYTVGALLFLLGARVRFAHLAWHVFVMVGSGLHVAAVLEAS